MKTGKYNGYKRGLYTYFADNNNDMKNVFSKYFGLGLSSVKIAFRREDLELMVLVKIKELEPDALIMFTVNRLDEYKFNYDNEELLNEILTSFRLGSRYKKIRNIRKRLNDK